MRCPNILGRVQSGSASTNSCTVACEVKFSMISTIHHEENQDSQKCQETAHPADDFYVLILIFFIYCL